MNFVRKSVLVIITPIFIFLLFAAAFDMGVLRVVNQPSNVKQILAASGIYNTAINNILDNAKQQTSDNGSVDLTNPTIKAAANATFTPQYIQQNTENVIDAVYAWLNGQTPQPQFSIDLSSLKQKFATAAGQAAAQRAASLPVCTDASQSAAAASDAINATCLPPGVTPAAVGSEVQGNIVDGQGFLNNTVINANTFKYRSCPFESNGVPCSQRPYSPVFSSALKNAPMHYQQVKKTPIILAVLSLLAAVAIVFLSATRRSGLRHAGVLLLLIGLFMLVFAWGVNYAVANKAVPKIKLNNAVVQTDVRKVVIEVEQKIDQSYWIFGGVYAALGILAIGASMLMPKPKTKNDDGLEGEGKTADDRIDLKAPDKVTNLSEAKPKTQPKTVAKPLAKRNIKVDVKTKE